MLIIIIFLLSSYPFQPVLCDRDIIPVFLIDHSSVLDDVNIEPNPFSKISTAFFADIVHGVIKKSEVVIVFVEDQLSVEDISTKDALGTPYRNLQVGLIEKKVKYLPKVIDPYKLLNQVFQPHQFNVFHLSSGMNLKMLEGKFKHLYIFFRDGKNETRAEVLRRHDLIMREVYTVMKQLVNGPVFAFYTGKMNPVQREKVEFVPIAPLEETKFPGVMVVTDGALYRFVGVFASTFTRRAVFNQIPMVAEETSNSESLSTKMAYSDFDLQFNFLLREKDWLLDTVALLEGGEEVGRTTMSVGAPWHHAFYCGEPLVIINNRDGSSVTISEYKYREAVGGGPGRPRLTPPLNIRDQIFTNSRVRGEANRPNSTVVARWYPASSVAKTEALIAPLVLLMLSRSHGWRGRKSRREFLAWSG
ncbi:hypothetical protein evm_012317 [Chilo suppressalis]|nr:hypothetical protein evm_012317 [Chilo suppressalis]